MQYNSYLVQWLFHFAIFFVAESFKDIVQLAEWSDSWWLFNFCTVILKLKAWKMLQN